MIESVRVESGRIETRREVEEAETEEEKEDGVFLRHPKDLPISDFGLKDSVEVFCLKIEEEEIDSFRGLPTFFFGLEIGIEKLFFISVEASWLSRS